MRVDLDGLLAGHAAAGDFGLHVLDADAALGQYFGHAADDTEPIRADQLELDTAQRRQRVGVLAAGRRPWVVILKLWQATHLASQSVTEKEMSISLEAIQAEVLRLSPSDRSRLLERLIVSLDADAEVEAEWDVVAEAREAEITSGVATPIPLEKAMARLEARFKG